MQLLCLLVQLTWCCAAHRYTQLLFLDLQGYSGQCTVKMDLYLDFCARCFLLPAFLLLCVASFNRLLNAWQDNGQMQKALSMVGLANEHRLALTLPLLTANGDALNAIEEDAPSTSKRARQRWQKAGQAVLRQTIRRRQFVRGCVEVMAFCEAHPAQDFLI